MRTTIEISDKHRAALLEMAARRGEKGFSSFVGEALEAYLRDQRRAAAARRKALGRQSFGARGGSPAPSCRRRSRVMALTVADTDVLIDFLAGRGKSAQRVARELDGGQLAMTAIARFELLSGMTARSRGALSALLEAVPALPLDSPAADRAAELRRNLERSGESIGMGDSLIAGIVLSVGGDLLTRNTRHFSRVNGLRRAALEGE